MCEPATISSSRGPGEPPSSWCRPSPSSSPRTAASRPASCARSRRHPWPCASPRACHSISNSIYTDAHERSFKDSILHTPFDNILVLPADLVAETADSAVLAAGLQAQDTEGLGNNHLLLLVVRGGNTLEDLEALKGGGTAGGLVGDHAADGLVENAGGGAEMEGTCGQLESRGSQSNRSLDVRLTTAGGVVPGRLAKVGVVLDCVRLLAFCPIFPPHCTACPASQIIVPCCSYDFPLIATIQKSHPA